jgi:hypothetical protein
LIALAALGAGEARAQQRVATLDHAGSVGLLLGSSLEFSTTEIADCVTCGTERAFATFSPVFDLGGSLAIGDEGNELIARLRLVRFSEASGETLLLGYRGYFGFEEWKSYFGLELQGTLRPVRTVGARASIGVMYELSSLFGLWAEAGSGFGLGGGRRFGVDLGLGLQARSYLLE